jgi:phytoene dehydrogenase-like protein
MTSMTRRGFVKTSAALAPFALARVGRAQQSPRATTPSPDRFDFVIAGAGHNSLITAAYLAKAGYRVVVLEGRPTIGGGCKTAEICLPGFKQDLCSSVHTGIQSNPLIRNNELNLGEYGLEYIDPDPVMHIPFADGTSITVWRDLERTAAEIARFSTTDADTFRRLVPDRVKWIDTPPAERGKLPSGPFWEKVSAMSGYDAACAVWESYQMRAGTLACGHFGGVPAGDPGTGNQAFSLIGQVVNGRPIAKGGSGMLSVALGRFIEAHHGVILTSRPVARLLIEGARCVGVECVDASRFRATRAVVSTIHLKHIVDMAPRKLWGERFLESVRLFQPEHAMFVFHYATTEAPKYPLASGGTISSCEAAILQRAESIHRLNYMNASGELDLSDLPLQIVSPSVADPTRVPSGGSTLKIEGTLPYALKEGPGHWDAIKDRVAETLLDHLRRFAPNLTPDKVLAKFLLSPLDIERMNPAMWRGSAHHGDRRLPQFAPYRMPIPGLYQTGACTAPGGSITGNPGRNAAAVLLEDQGRSLDEVVGGTRTPASA